MDLRHSQFTFSNKENTQLQQKQQQQQQQQPPPRTPRQSKSHNVIFKDTTTPTANTQPQPHTYSNAIDKPVKRVPLGGKDKNTSHGAPLGQKGLSAANGNVNMNMNMSLNMNMNTNISASAQKRARRLRTPVGNKSATRKLDILRDIDIDLEMKSGGGGYSKTPLDVDSTLFTRHTSEVHEGEGVDDDYEIEYIPVKQPELPYIPLNYTPFTDEDLAVLKQSPSVRLHDKRDLLSDIGSSDDDEEGSDRFPVNFNFDEGDNDFGEEEFVHKKSTNTGLPHFMEPTFVSNAKKSNKVDVFQDGLTIGDLQKLIDEDQ